MRANNDQQTNLVQIGFVLLSQFSKPFSHSLAYILCLLLSLILDWLVQTSNINLQCRGSYLPFHFVELIFPPLQQLPHKELRDKQSPNQRALVWPDCQ